MQNLFKDVGSLDRRCYDTFGLSEALLMEHAAEAMAVQIRERFQEGSRVQIVCGPGNNGADGIALGRLLYGRYSVTLQLPHGAKSEMAQWQRECARRIGVREADEMESCDVLVDALFGSGLSRQLDGRPASVLSQMNSSHAFKLACDMHTGVFADGRCDTAVFRADLTVSMVALKRGMFSDAAKEAVGEIVVADLGVDRSVYETNS
ncbi:MAG TPA: NAD(P)H-hydrate epimerase, partial [Sulfuricurvum sp.]|nr:NAD(P)H-hydrate epimerase [Sulfuricurvum sp.]